MRVEERELLMAVNDIDGVVDIEGHRLGRRRVAGAIEIDHDPHQADQIAQPGRILPARDGRLRAQVDAAVGQPATSQLEPRIGAQPVEIVGILPAAGDGKDAGAQYIGQPMGDPLRIAAVRDHRRQPRGEAEPAFGLGEQHHPAIGAEPAAIKRGGHFFARNRWKRERQQAIVGDGGRGGLRSAARTGFSNQILQQINGLCYLRQPKIRPVSRVEEGRGIRIEGIEAFRLPSPLIKPDVRVSRIRLSDWLHLKARGGGPRCTRRRWNTPSVPKTASRLKRLVPRVGTL